MSASIDKTLSLFEQRLLAEAVRSAEDGGTTVANAATAELAAIAGGGSFEKRVCARATAIGKHLGLQHSLSGFLRGTRLASWIIIGAGMLIGGTAAQSTLIPDRDGLVNFFWTLLVLLGVHTLAMIGWIVLLLFRGRLPPLTPLRAPFRAIGRVLAPAPIDSGSTRALATWTAIATTGPLGRWSASTLIHGFWLAALTGMLVTTLVLLSARQFDFVWETTILPERTFVSITSRLEALPAALGLETLDRETILASRRSSNTRPPAHARRGWSALLIGSLLGAGLLPRAVLMLFSMLMLRHARSRFRLDLELPGYSRLHFRLMPVSQRIGVVDPETGMITSGIAPDIVTHLPLTQNTAVLGVEIDTPATGWPPAIVRHARDLGIVTDREAQAAAMRSIAELQRAPLSLLIVCSLLTSPDRGVARLLRELRGVHKGPMAVLLTQGNRLSTRTDEHGISERFQDWRHIAIAAGVDAAHVVCLDLDDAEAVRDFMLARQKSKES